MDTPSQEDQQSCPITRDEVRRMLAETEKGVSEGRLRFVLCIGTAIFALFGLIVPIWQTNTSSEKVDKDIKDVETKFEKLAGEELRKPDIVKEKGSHLKY